jgi:hypothetical protein
MKQIIFFVLYSSFVNLVVGQDVNKHEYIGTIQLSNNTIITYKINFVLKPDNTFEGISETDFYGVDYTRAKIKGKINPLENTITFKETENISTKSSSSEEEFCFVDVTNAKYKTASNKSVIQGSFNGKYSNRKNCVDGYIYLLGSKFIDALTNKMLHSPHFTNKDSVKLTRQTIDKLREQSQYYILKKDNTLNLNWHAPEIIIEVSDGKIEDMDEITISINEKKILEKFVINKQKKIIVFPITEKINTIRIFALNEGKAPPNTAYVVLRDAKDSTAIVATLRKGESTLIRLTQK